MSYADRDGELAVRIAREALEAYVVKRAKRTVEIPRAFETKSVTFGVDGLSVAQGPYRGLLLPQVAVEYAWDAAEFLSEACMKAGLLADAWLDPATRVYKFQAEVFAETQPRGPVVRRTLEAA